MNSSACKTSMEASTINVNLKRLSGLPPLSPLKDTRSTQLYKKIIALRWHEAMSREGHKMNHEPKKPLTNWGLVCGLFHNPAQGSCFAEASIMLNLSPLGISLPSSKWEHPTAPFLLLSDNLNLSATAVAATLPGVP